MGRGKALGIYVTDHFIQIMQLKKEGEAIVIHSVGEKIIPHGMVKNGEVMQEKELAEEITSLLPELKPYVSEEKRCICAIPESQVFEHIFYLPNKLKGDELLENLEKLIEETIPLPFYELQYSYSISLHGNVQVVFVTAVRRLIVAQYYQVLKTFAKLDPIIFEPESLSLLRNLPLNFTKDEGLVLIHLDGQKINWFTVWSGNIFDSSSVRIEDFKKNPASFVESITQSISAFEITTKRKIMNIYIAGDLEKAPELKQSIETTIKQIPIKHIDKYKITFQPKEGETMSQFKIVSGLALKGLQIDGKTKINLLTKEITK